ncbi:hypothetical protein DDZ13_10140 [Coraliomargarita sinensis]|uniref:VWFA domain-containing protein n=1 Tax=Coraliomargarita sinensis TaxID=2174842 RepID=A0A317ZIC0_9BACT|nr:hypothetical protein [Coraliomargarita sinensis]PXA03648.1 hypothetical protein DDZ13_10140 [Coraliomargarita sinensis]
MKQFFGRKSRSAMATVLVVSLVLHVVAVLIFGTIKFVSDVLREETVFEAAEIAPPQQKEPEYQVNIQQRNQSVPPPRPPAIVVNNPSELSIPSLDIDVNVDSSSVYGRGGGGFGDGLAGVREMAISANLFGKTVQAETLGVILDVSFSTHNVLSAVIDEIQSAFPDAIIVFAPGCAIDSRKNELVPIKDYEKTAEDYTGGRYATKPFVDRLLKREDFKEIWDRTRRRNKGFVVFSEIRGPNGLSGCDVAMKFLVDNGADLIYWFADFDDSIDADLADDVARYMRRKDTKLMLHDFKGNLGKGNNQEPLEMMARKTGGEFFLKLFKDK